ncbi:Uncharacterised protein [Vibrio cholerae]|nr:Uncharacterised protein [Vibrio cholerae]
MRQTGFASYCAVWLLTAQSRSPHWLVMSSKGSSVRSQWLHHCHCPWQYQCQPALKLGHH